MNDVDNTDDLSQIVDEFDSIKKELTFLFGSETVDLASQLDIAELNLKDEIVKDIGTNVGELKKLKNDPHAQREFINKLEQGSRILLCMWIMDMDLLNKIQIASYPDS